MGKEATAWPSHGIELRICKTATMTATYGLTVDDNLVAVYAAAGEHEFHTLLESGRLLTERQAKHQGFTWPEVFSYRKKK